MYLSYCDHVFYLLYIGDCFHGGAKNLQKDDDSIGYIRIHGYLTSPKDFIGTDGLTQGWLRYFLQSIKTVPPFSSSSSSSSRSSSSSSSH
jgi:hypothetical protein